MPSSIQLTSNTSQTTLRALLLPLIACLLGCCAYAVDWRIEPVVVTSTLTEENVLERYVAITQGDCSTERASINGMNSTRLAEGETFPATSVQHGPHCFWSLQVRRFHRAGVGVELGEEPCRLEAIGSTQAVLPADSTVVVREALMGDDERPRWDDFVATLARCAPQRDPARCTCPYSAEANGACAAPVRGSLIAAGPDHVCTALFGAPSMTCWGNVQGWTDAPSPLSVGPTLVVNPFLVDAAAPEDGGRSIIQLEAGDQATCIRAVGAKSRCFGAKGAGYNNASTGNFGNGIRDLTVGADFACGLDSNGAVCRGGPSATMFQRALIEPGIVDLDAGDAHLCWIANGRLACITSEGASACPDCTDTTWTQVAATGNHTCGVRGERLFCWENNATSIELFAIGTVTASASPHWVCSTAGGGVSRCGPYPGCGTEHRAVGASFNDCARPLPSTWSLVTLDGDNACASVGNDAFVRCAPLDASMSVALLGRIATTAEGSLGEETSSVCPYPAPLP